MNSGPGVGARQYRTKMEQLPVVEGFTTARIMCFILGVRLVCRGRTAAGTRWRQLSGCLLERCRDSKR